MHLALKKQLLSLKEKTEERKTTLFEFFTVPCLYLPFPHPATSKGFAEKVVRRRLEKKGWIVWRGGSLHNARRDVFPNVKEKYRLFEHLMDRYVPGKKEFLQYLSSSQHGMPDFLCFFHGTFLFVECKFRHEQLSERQKKCIARLQKHGFHVEVHKVVTKETKVRRAVLELHTGRKHVLEQQKRLCKVW